MENLPTFKFRDRKPEEKLPEYLSALARDVDQSVNEIRQRLNWLLEREYVTTETAGILDRDGTRYQVSELVQPGQFKNTDGNFRIRLAPDGANFQNVLETRKSGVWTAVMAVDKAGNWIIEKTAGVGIKVDLTNPTFGWRDLKGKVTQRNTGASKPTHATWFGGLKQYQFAAGKEEYFTYHIDHDHVPDSDIHLHIHWSHIGALVTGGTITLEYEISYAKGFSQAAFGTPASTTFTGTASTVQRGHVITEIQISAATPDANQIDSGDLEPDGIIECRVKVTSVDITVSGGGVPDPFIHEADIHYQSTGVGTKQKAPDFYV